MSPSQRVRFRDLRNIFRLVGECRDVGDSPAAWRLHMLEGLGRLVGAPVGLGGESVWTGPERVLQPLEGAVFGWEKSQAEARWRQYLSHGGTAADPAVQAISRLRRILVTRVREQLIDDRTWYGSVHFNEFRKPSGIDHFIMSFHALDDAQTVNAIGLFRPLDAPPFSLRERHIVHLFHRELAPLVGSSLARETGDAPRDLPARLQQTLVRLLNGESEKEVARQLGLSQATVHQYVTALYRRFGVHSRSELLAKWIRLPVQSLTERW